ncbi:TIGR02302 family protein [Azospirillum halopraeferens]|uniref:TIGR02302 family protein n=1 Tax=Azospirillum halopraeferens TaxID=34010 RepID=UPI0006850D47|nr:TIGR02302 family protein [Azospirillum halopraeferens]
MQDKTTRGRGAAPPSPRPVPGRDAGAPAGHLALARAALLWERLWPALWIPAALVGAFLALALLNILPMLPGWLHAAVLAVFAVAIGGTLWRGLRRVTLPDPATARRRVERDSGLAHRPLNALRDAPAGGDATAAALWRIHQERMRDSVRHLRVAAPHPNVAARDPLALRMAVGLVLFVAVAGGWHDWRPRLSAALTPHLGGGAVAAPVALDLWLTPPEYTGLPPIFLRAGTGPATEGPAGPVMVPEGSLVLGRVTGGASQPALQIGDERVPFETVDSGSFQVQAPVTAGHRIAVTQGGGTLGSWAIEVIADSPPAIEFAAPPARSERGALRIEYAARDDYGIAAVSATVRLAPEDLPETVGREPLELPLPLPGINPKEARQAAFHDLTDHPWAGLPVTLRLTAVDGAAQTGETEDFAMVLPERVFNHPIARAIVEQRKRLTLEPGAREPVAEILADLSAIPARYGHDLVVFLALRTAAARLMLDADDAAVTGVQRLLWETALRIEDGGLSLAERDLRDAERRLAEALDRNASDEEIRQLMDQLQEAFDRFMEAMAENLRQALERGEEVPMIPPEMAQNMMNQADLQEMMDRMREMAETGARDAARQMLSQLQQMLENMRAGMMAQMPQGQNQAMQAMRDMQDLMQQQQELMDESFRSAQDQMNAMNGMPQPGGEQSPRGRGGRQQQQQSASPLTQQQAERQEALRRQLGEMMRRMGEQMGDIPQPLGRAERAMRDAAQALQQGAPGAAVPSQGQALQELQQGLQGMAEQMMQQMAGPGMMMGPPGAPPNQPGRNRDPLGRRPDGFNQVDDGQVKIPGEADIQRAREILDELRRRSGEYDRPQMEREYIERLLRQF